MNKRKIGIIGNGNVGSALSRGLTRTGYEVKAVGAGAKANRDIAAWADIVIVAVPFGAIGNVAKEIADAVKGKIVVDTSNALDGNMALALGYTTSGAEELQKTLVGAHVVKTFNMVFAQHMDSGRVNDTQLTAFVAADDATAKEAVIELARSIGFDAVNAGPLANARLLEPIGYLNIQLGYVLGMGTQIGFKLVHG
jgi:8-hydroxy-5-deazaflavin:NADPH oxidoreductase